MSNYEHLNDHELSLRVAGGDRDAFGEVYDRYGEKVAAIASRFVGDDNAADLTQEVFLEFWERAIEYDADRASMLTYLAVLARSRSIDHVRKDSRRERLLHVNRDMTRPRELTPPGERSVQRSRLRTAIEDLEPDLVEVVRLAYYEGQSTSEISENLDVPQGTVKSRMRRAREVLSAVLVGEGV